MLHFANSANDIRKIIVGNTFTNNCSAVPNIITKLVNCSDNSIFAFIVVWLL